ncbi:helix-turn-helix transcriptional regulator [bacterium]|nr:helix-turn-helix transcriptional regulator [bacterium]
MKRKYPGKNTVQASFGSTVRKWRRSKGWSQEKLAEECDLHRTYIGGIERGERNVSLVNIKKLADSLGVSARKLFEEI